MEYNQRWWVFLLLTVLIIGARSEGWESTIRMPIDQGDPTAEDGTRWAVLVAGSKGFGNYRHQADVCHAYQLLRKGGLKEENIVVFMYDDIAMHRMNPRPGIIINHPNGHDVYSGVPKDYTGEHVTAKNLFAVLLGDKKAVKGGSGKVVDSKPNDRIFVYYSDHGGPGVLGMPNMPFVYAMDFIEVLKKKHASRSYKEMVLYIEACESGSIFEGIMPKDLNIYVTTASSAQENSWGTYCPGSDPAPPAEYDTCLGDLYSVAWMEDSETHNLKRETLKQQYETVKKRTGQENEFTTGSHVMEYGNKSITSEKVYLYQGFDPETLNYPPNRFHAPMGVVNQRDADLHYLWQLYKRSDPDKKTQVLSEIKEITRHRAHLDATVDMVGNILFGRPSVLKVARPEGEPLVDSWRCLKRAVQSFEERCGPLTQYGMKHMRAFANICNSGLAPASVDGAFSAACSGQWRGANIYSDSDCFSS